MQKVKMALRNLVPTIVILLTAPSVSSANDAIVEIPTARTSPQSKPTENVTLGGEYKATKNVIEEEKPVFSSWYFDAGYESEYNFRGTDLMPDSDGGGFFNAQVSKWNFTLGFFGIHQFGKAASPSWSIGESGGSGGVGLPVGANFFGLILPVPLKILRFPTTIQDRFNELDVFLSYKLSLGPIDITVGDIGFFIDRRAETFERDFLATPGFTWNPFVVGSNGGRSLFLGPFGTVENEVFDRVYIRLSTSKIPHIVPQITYYQTVLSDGSDPHATKVIQLQSKPGGPPAFQPLPYSVPHDERNDALGGYLEGRINGHFALTKWMDFNPYGVVSVSFRDRTEPGGANPFSAHPLTGWNHAQGGAELPIHLLHCPGFSSTTWAAPDLNVYFVPFGAYAYHISNPTIGTDRDEWWGGAKFELTF